MSMIRWNPAFDLLNVHSELDRVFNELVGGTGFNPRYNGEGQAPAYLPIDIRREDNRVVIEASVPGFRPEDVSVTFEGGALTIAAGRDEAHSETTGEYVRRERYAGKFYRQIALGDQVDGDRAEAGFNNGVLTVTVPMVSKPEPRRIPVNPTETTG
jgi:HSP20 family protein